jgi:hypothetical protein
MTPRYAWLIREGAPPTCVRVLSRRPAVVDLCGVAYALQMGDAVRSYRTGRRMLAEGTAMSRDPSADDLREALRFLCRADVERCWFCGATATKRSPSTSWWCDVCARAPSAERTRRRCLARWLPALSSISSASFWR